MLEDLEVLYLEFHPSFHTNLSDIYFNNSMNVNSVPEYDTTLVYVFVFIFETGSWYAT
jgi:hypothetical protein